jgi:hypothetical protein
MMATKEASAKIAGYIFQFERALYRLFSSELEITTVGIETDDDVVEIAQDESGEVLIKFEQDKHTVQETGHPYQDSSKNLWHTLHIWLEAMQGVRKKYGNVTYCLVTNKEVPISAFAKNIGTANDDIAIDACIVDIRNYAKNAAGEVAAKIKAVAAFSNDDLHFLIKNLLLMDEFGTASGATPKNATIQLFHLPPDIAEKGLDIYQSVLGLLVDACQEGWKKKQPVWITKDVVAERLQSVIATHRMARYVDQPLFSTSYKQYLNADGNSHYFLKQLQHLGADSSMCDRALSHYWGFYAERIRLQSEGDILPKAWNERNSQLHERREMIGESVKLEADMDVSRDVLAKRILAKTIVGDYMAPLGLHKTSNAYFTSGNYHDLANQPEHTYFIHWHPKFAPNTNDKEKK